MLQRRRGQTRPTAPGLRDFGIQLANFNEREAGCERCRSLQSRAYATDSTNERLTHIRPQIRRDYPLNLSILLGGGKETDKDSPVAASEQGGAQHGIPRGDAQGDVFGRSHSPGVRWGESKSPLNAAIARRGCHARRTATAPGWGLSSESCSLRVEHYEGGKLHLRLNKTTRPIANKYREGKLKKNFEERVQYYVKPFRGKRERPGRP